MVGKAGYEVRKLPVNYLGPPKRPQTDGSGFCDAATIYRSCSAMYRQGALNARVI